MKKLVIDRSRWLRGETGEFSYLYREDDRKMCCLGFYLRSCGVPVKAIESIGSPEDVDCIPKQARWLVDEPLPGVCTGVNAGATLDLMKANDAQWLPDAEREKRIKKLFAAQGVAVKFVGKPRR